MFDPFRFCVRWRGIWVGFIWLIILLDPVHWAVQMGFNVANAIMLLRLYYKSGSWEDEGYNQYNGFNGPWCFPLGYSTVVALIIYSIANIMMVGPLLLGVCSRFEFWFRVWLWAKLIGVVVIVPFICFLFGCDPIAGTIYMVIIFGAFILSAFFVENYRRDVDETGFDTQSVSTEQSMAGAKIIKTNKQPPPQT